MMRLWILFLLPIICFVGNVDAAESLDCTPTQCLIVIDAGSTGSRLHLFHYERDKTQQPIHVVELYAKKISPGFSNVVLNQENVNVYVEQLFSELPKDISLPVYFYATAGMRLLPKATQQHYYAMLQEWFRHQENWTLLEAKTITGQEEGVLGWLAVNELLGNFDTPEHSLMGVMDMGGASVQVVFPLDGTDAIDAKDVVSVGIGERRMHLFVHSFLGLGQTLLSQQFLEAEHCYPTGYELPNGILAEGNAEVCREEISQLINTIHGVHRRLAPAIAQAASNDWYSMGGLAAMASEAPFHFPEKKFTTDELMVQADTEVCRSSWNALEARYPKNYFLYNYCLFSSYYTALIQDGYGISKATPIHFFAKEQNVDWTRGVVLQHPETRVYTPNPAVVAQSVEQLIRNQ